MRVLILTGLILGIVLFIPIVIYHIFKDWYEIRHGTSPENRWMPDSKEKAESGSGKGDGTQKRA